MSEADVTQNEIEEQPPANDELDFQDYLEETEDETRGELMKFIVLVVVLLGTVLVIALLRPTIFDRIVPAVLGEDQPAATLMESEAEVETLKPEVEDADAAANEAENPNEGESDSEEEGNEEGNESIDEPVNPEDFPTAVPAQTHTVQPGENLTAIARQYNTTVQAIVTANNITNPDRVTVGTVLTIPNGQ